MAIGTRDRLLDTALAVFAEHGAAGATMREIARRAGVNVATPYHHFSSKRDLLLAIFRERGLLDLPDPDAMPEAGSDDKVDRLTLLLVGAWAVMAGSEEVIRLAVIEALRGDEDVRAVFTTWQQRGDAYIERIVRDFCGDREPARFALIVRHVIWSTLIEQLMKGPVDLEAIAASAPGVARDLLGGSA